MEATRFLFRPEASRVIIWITDADYHERNPVTSLTRSEVIDALLANEITVHSVGNTFSVRLSRALYRGDRWPRF